MRSWVEQCSPPLLGEMPAKHLVTPMELQKHNPLRFLCRERTQARAEMCRAREAFNEALRDVGLGPFLADAELIL